MFIKRMLISCLLLTLHVQAQNFVSVDQIINNAIQNDIFPAASIIVGKNSSIIYHKAYGRLTYDPNATETDTSVMFDLASLTKVMCTTMCAMKLYDSGLLNLEEYVWQTIPEFAQNGKENVKIKNLLLHNSGLPIGYGAAPGEPRDQIIYDIMTIAPQYPLGTFVYSDLSMVVLAEVISVKVDTMFPYYYRDTWTSSLGMTSTMFAPPDSLDFRIAPTVNYLNRGVVHDALARSLDGLSGNAGLFSSTGDLAIMAQLLLGEGVYQGTRYLQQSTVQLFRMRHDPQGSTRALGWDTDCQWMGTQLSDQRFGHTGYTGTSITIDPTYDLFIILLTNRTYPDVTPDMFTTRRLVHDAVVSEFTSPTQKIVDNDDPQNYFESGTWYDSNAQAYGPSSRYTDLNQGTEPFASFRAVMDQSGVYNISGIVPETVNAANNAIYELSIENTAIDSIHVNQNTNSGSWVLLWNHFLPADTTIKVRIIDTGESTEGIVLRADAIKFSLKGSIDDIKHAPAQNTPVKFELKQNYPNPFNPSTTIEFSIPKLQHVTLKIYNTLGQQVATLLDKGMNPGSHNVQFDASTLPSGIYFCRIQVGDAPGRTGEFSQVRKMVLIK